MPRTATKDENSTETLPLVSETADVHHIVRTLASQNLTAGAIGPDAADTLISHWLQQGYALHTVVPMQTVNIDGIWGVQILYILTRD